MPYRDKDLKKNENINNAFYLHAIIHFSLLSGEALVGSCMVLVWQENYESVIC